MTQLRAIGALAAALLALAVSPVGARSATLDLGFFDPTPFVTQPDAATWAARGQAAGASVVRLTMLWSSVAPTTPPVGFDAADPASPGYRWAALDRQVKTLVSEGFTPFITITVAPSWAEGSDRPASARAGTWKPDPTMLGQFARAIATRYSGSYPDPSAAGQSLPRVRLWQIWNEPNLYLYLTPQWEKRDGKYVATSPGLYRDMLNHGYAAIKAAQPDAEVFTAGTAPYGDPEPGGRRIAPALFMRDMLCLQGTSLTKVRCSAPTHFDAYDHHVYGIRSPTQTALNADDVAAPDLAKLQRIVARAVSLGTALPKRSKPLWVTEVAYDSKPPDPHGVPLAQHALWLEQALSVLSRQGVPTVLWFSITDQPPIPSYEDTYQAGLYLLDGTPKPAATAYRFPFVRTGNLLWGRAPAAGTVIVERQVGTRWKAVDSIRLAARQTFSVSTSLSRSVRLRARQGSVTSLTWPVS